MTASAPANVKPRAGEHLPIPATYIIRRGARLTECEAERDQLRMREKELVEALSALTDICDSVPVFQLDDGKASVKAVRLAAKFTGAHRIARAVLSKVRGA